MALKPWYKVVTPREDLRVREGKPLDASEFAVHLDQVREGKGACRLSKAGAIFRAYVSHQESRQPRKSALRELGLNDDIAPK